MKQREERERETQRRIVSGKAVSNMRRRPRKTSLEDDHETDSPALAKLLRNTKLSLSEFMLQDEVQDIVKEWEKSLPHNEFFFPGVPLFESDEIRREFTAPSSSSTYSPPVTYFSRPLEHECLLLRDLEMGRVTSESKSIAEGTTFALDDFFVHDGEGAVLVRRDGTAVEAVSLSGKHILLCCFHMPLYWSSNSARYARSISSLCAELASSKFRDEYEIVIVAKMAPHWAECEAAFDHFCEAFPPSCLTVPFRCEKLIDRIFQSLNLQSVCPRAVIIGPDGKVLSTGDYPFISFGVKDGFPFSNERLRAVVERDNSLLSGASTRPLATLLGGWDPLPSDHRLRDVVTGEERISISELEKKDVAVYLCCKGDLLDRLSEAYDKVKNKKKPGFEVVVVLFPDVTGLGKSEFKLIMTSAFKLQSLPWLVLPTDNSVARRLVRICGDTDKLNEFMSDRLLIVGAGGKYVDPIGDVILKLCDIDYAYPFSFTGLVEREVDRLGAVKLDSILDEMESVLRLGKRKQKWISKAKLKAKLKNKRVCLFYTDVEMPKDGRQFGVYNNHPWQRLKKLKDAYPGCRVLYVPSREMEYDFQDFPKDLLSMYMCPFNASLDDHLGTLTSVALTGHPESLGFGEDGHLASLGLTDHLFANSLTEDIFRALVSSLRQHDKNYLHARLSRLGGLMCSACMKKRSV